MLKKASAHRSWEVESDLWPDVEGVRPAARDGAKLCGDLMVIPGSHDSRQCRRAGRPAPRQARMPAATGKHSCAAGRTVFSAQNRGKIRVKEGRIGICLRAAGIVVGAETGFDAPMVVSAY